MESLINLVILFLHIVAIGALTLIALRVGKEAIIAWLALLGVTANIFVQKQIGLIGLSVTCSDSLMVGMILGINLIQEYYGKKTAQRAIWISFFVMVAYLILSQFHLAYHPLPSDDTQQHFEAIFLPLPRIICASLVTFLCVQFFDIGFFGFLQRKFSGSHLLFRTVLSLIVSQTFDTILFTLLGLYGLVDSVIDIVLFSLLIKCFVIILSSPFIIFSKKIVRQHASV